VKVRKADDGEPVNAGVLVDNTDSKLESKLVGWFLQLNQKREENAK